ncbi:hypothetical protein LEP48_00630 [Isoptericola sp. NEAU-Y5]|uniref:Excreted virulence factor EspC (Type VII ESX diderm) n=1 Tax=Isoptericola luteus TaxID=2879484 RepID=A0ABS7ZA01_9MICO|nr:hypothetical protein [Isoptericola sp. NEAU-Y5]MCA5891855.1 hypothetical protein [Isoptericola sp. NEAU-Y5]
MAYLDIDTTTLLTASSRARGAGSALAAADTFGTGGRSVAAAVTGDPTLAAALEDLTSAWAATRTSLASELDALAGGLAHAGELFSGAETLTAARFAELLGDGPS